MNESINQVFIERLTRRLNSSFYLFIQGLIDVRTASPEEEENKCGVTSGILDVTDKETELDLCDLWLRYYIYWSSAKV